MTHDDGSLRLNKHLALQLGISRREADQFIEQGRVLVDGTVASLGGRVTDTAVVTLDGQPVTSTQSLEYLIFHKPVGYVCSRRQQGDNPTIYSLLPKSYHHLKPVGRLDKDSSGILLLTNDGDFAHQMMHPSFYKVKVYEVILDHDLEPLHQQMISDHGVALEDGVSKFELERLSEGNRQEWQITMREGRNRQIRRTFAALGYGVKKLHRTTFGSYGVGSLPVGEYQTTDRV